MSDFSFEHCLTHCARAVALDALLRTEKVGGLVDDHHFYLTFWTDFPDVVLPAQIPGIVDDEMTIVLQHRFEDLAIEDEMIAVTLYFDGRPEPLRIPVFALTRFRDPSVQFTIDFPRCKPEEVEALRSPFRFAMALVEKLMPLSRMDYAAKGDRVCRAITAWLIGAITQGEAGDIVAELEVDTRYPGLKVTSGAPVAERWTVRIDDMLQEVRISDTAISFLQESLPRTIPLGALRSVKIVNEEGVRPLILGEPAPLERLGVPLSIVSTLRANASRSLRALMVYALEATQMLGRLPQGRHFYLHVATQYPGVDLPKSVREQYPNTVILVIQYLYSALVCSDDAVTVTLSFSGEEARVRIPYLAVTAFSDPSVPRTWSFGDSDVRDTLSASILAAAREQIGPVEKRDWLDYAALEKRAQGVAIAAALSELAAGRPLAQNQGYRILVDRTLSSIPAKIAASTEANDDPIALQIDASTSDYYSTSSSIGWRDPNTGLRLDLPHHSIREFTAFVAEDEYTIVFPASTGASPVIASAAEPAHVRLTRRYISKQGHLVHKLKAKDSTDRWAYYFVLVMPMKEREFMAAIEGDGMIDLEDYGKVLASSYGEQPTDEVWQYLRDIYGFDV